MDAMDHLSHAIAETNTNRARSLELVSLGVDHMIAEIERVKTEFKKNGDAKALKGLIALTGKEFGALGEEELKFALDELKSTVELVVHQEDDVGLVLPTVQDKTVLDKALAWNFLNDGYLDTAKRFCDDLGVQEDVLPEHEHVRARAGNEALDAMTVRKDVGPALAWLEEYASDSVPQTASLIFDLHRLRFLQLVGDRPMASLASQTEAIGYAQRNFAPFQMTRSQEIQALFSSLLFRNASSLSSSSSTVPPAATTRTFFLPTQVDHWELAKRMLRQEISRGINSMSVAIANGEIALKEMRHYQSLVVGTSSALKAELWSNPDGELPVQIEGVIPFHSEFCCPVTREHTDAMTNPPMLLVCGHVVSKNSISRIAKNRSKFKCPTCPQEQSIDAPTPVYF